MYIFRSNFHFFDMEMVAWLQKPCLKTDYKLLLNNNVISHTTQETKEIVNYF